PIFLSAKLQIRQNGGGRKDVTFARYCFFQRWEFLRPFGSKRTKFEWLNRLNGVPNFVITVFFHLHYEF
ncbi:MAG: hypothetical protein II065_10475, partial [Bacteroidaceae bacterium]|nr:hypothetical protein [Bacteroidaceae bacterium]